VTDRSVVSYKFGILLLAIVINCFLFLGFELLFNDFNGRSDNTMRSESKLASRTISNASDRDYSSYSILLKQDLSYSAISEVNFEQLTINEIEAAPTVLRYKLDVLIPTTTQRVDVLAYAENVIRQLRSAEPNIDELAIYFYNDSNKSSSGDTIASAFWAPGGEWGSSTAESVRSSTKSSNAITIKMNTFSSQ
jgi:hypothetical protein